MDVTVGFGTQAGQGRAEPARTGPAGGDVSGRGGGSTPSAWGVFVFAITPRHFHYKGLGAGLAVALTGWSPGARHGFDADHISAIDNTSRKLMADGGRPLGTGFFFALGHSSIIVVVGAGLAVAAHDVFRASWTHLCLRDHRWAHWHLAAGGDLAAITYWKTARIEDGWTTNPQPAD